MTQTLHKNVTKTGFRCSQTLNLLDSLPSHVSMTQPRIRKCWSCKQRRLKCDGGLPHCLKCWSHGVECLGYKKPLVWVEGVARRGPMKNRTFADIQHSQSTSFQGTAFDVSRGQHHQSEQLTRPIAASSVPVALVEPLFKDMSYTSRFFVDYC